MNILEKLFGSQARVRLLRVFYQNPKNIFTQKETVKMAKVSSRAVSKELKLLFSLGFLEKGARSEEVKNKKSKKPKIRKIKGFLLSETFPLFSALRSLVITASPASRENLLNFFRRYRKIKLVCISGIFLDSISTDSTDLLIVGNGVKKGALDKFIKKLEPDLGREINWTHFSLTEFNDRVAMHDKFLRDFLDSPNECLINKISVEERA